MASREPRPAGGPLSPHPPGSERALVLGAVAYAPKVVTIWDGFKEHLTGRGLPFDYVLYSNYERLVEDLVAGVVDVAWNSPLAWLRAERLARARGEPVRAAVMRDTDRDLASLVVVRADGPVRDLAALRGRTVAVGAVDSPQATLIPLDHLRRAGLRPGEDFEVQRHDLLAGKHGDHIGGEREAARALVEGRADAACMIDANLLLFVSEGTLQPGATRVLAQTARYDHCNLTVRHGAPAEAVERLRALLLEMSYDDPSLRPLLDLEGLKRWLPARTEGYRLLDEAVDADGFYDREGRVLRGDYRP